MALLFMRRDDIRSDYVSIGDEIETAGGRRFEIAERIAAGGNGVVHRCIDFGDGLEYAVKFQLDMRQRRRRRFARELDLLSRLRHDHLVAYEDQGEAGGERHRGRRITPITVPFVVMMLAGGTLAEHIRANEVPPEVFVAQFRGLARGLGMLHEVAVHRDIKPENILVARDRWILSDYGLCDPHDCDDDDRVTPHWEILGPRFWMSPEANNRSIGRQDDIDASSDVFQLASVFWFVVNRSHPTGVLTRGDWRGPDALFEPIHQALHHDRRVRPPNGRAFAEAIDAAVLR